MLRQRRPILGVGVEGLVDVLHTTAARRRRDEPLDLEHIGVMQEMHHRLKVVGIGAADVGRDDDPMAAASQRAVT